ncbi:MAG: two-component system, OmpR family, phosphate regulon sensor histidine kinase PhoR [Abditibacteriota bacterium]|nr:two-component system, OmpR family, phosphate regulon sensor histidine kinase PhoR [Abditibacteriota bacterium]
MIIEIIAAIGYGLALCFGVLWQRARAGSARRRRWLSRILNALAQHDYARALGLAQASERDFSKDDAVGTSDDLPVAFVRAVRAIEMQEREERIARRELEDVLASLQDAVLVVDDESRLRFLNAAGSNLFGVEIEDVLGAQLLEALPSFDLDSAVREALQHGYTHAREVSLYVVPSKNGAPVNRGANGHFYRGDAGRREVLLRVAPVRRSNGAVSGAVAIVQDLTELRRLERVRRDFVANASHELRTPIANIRAAAETILDSSEDPTLVQRFLPRLVSEAERLSHLVSDLLDLARADSALELSRTRVEVSQVARAAIRRLEEKAQLQRIMMQCEDHPSCFVMGDAATLEQVVFNLLDNALMYTPPGGRVTVRVEPEQKPVAELSPVMRPLDGHEAPHHGASRSNAATVTSGPDTVVALDEADAPTQAPTPSPVRNILLSVSDTGIGIPQADLARIFERFYRVDKARSRAQGGTGLGLAIVKHIVEKHGGHVGVESEVGQGTTFIVSLPAV